jgi:hypothetical protein
LRSAQNSAEMLRFLFMMENDRVGIFARKDPHAIKLKKVNLPVKKEYFCDCLKK